MPSKTTVREPLPGVPARGRQPEPRAPQAGAEAPPEHTPQEQSAPPAAAAAPAVVDRPMTLERLGAGLGRALALLLEQGAAIEALAGRIDRLGGAIDDQREQIASLVQSMPDPDRWCPPWVDAEGTLVCEGGVHLNRTRLTEGDPLKRKEWTHPLPPGVTGRVSNPTTGEMQSAKNHNVYETRALKSPPGAAADFADERMAFDDPEMPF
jgi:hypothetical protein